MVDDQLIKGTFEVNLDKNLLTIVFKEALGDSQENKRQAELVEEGVSEIIKKDPSKVYNVIVNLLPIGGFNYMSPEAREIYGNLTKLQQWKKAAFVGNNTFMEIIVNLVMQASGKALFFKWFKSLDEAKAWLNE